MDCTSELPTAAQGHRATCPIDFALCFFFVSLLVPSRASNMVAGPVRSKLQDLPELRAYQTGLPVELGEAVLKHRQTAVDMQPRRTLLLPGLSQMRVPWLQKKFRSNGTT